MLTMTPYADIINCRRPASRRTRMTIAHRAKQFAPFAALKGYDESVRKKEVLFSPCPDLSEEKKEDLDRRLHLLHCRDRITVTFFLRDPSTPLPLGHYHTLTGTVEDIDPQNRKLRVANTEIFFRWLTDLDGKVFENEELP